MSCNINVEVTQKLVWILLHLFEKTYVIRHDLMYQFVVVYRKGAKLVAQLHRHLHLKRWKTLYIHSYLCSISICKTDAHCKTNWIWHFTGFHLHYNKKAAIENKCNIHFVIPRILLLLLFVTSILCVVRSNHYDSTKSVLIILQTYQAFIFQTTCFIKWCYEKKFFNKRIF